MSFPIPVGRAYDEVISLKHGGNSDVENLAYACVFCNRYKGSDIGSIICATQEFVRLYNPRRDRLIRPPHYECNKARIQISTQKSP